MPILGMFGRAAYSLSRTESNCWKGTVPAPAGADPTGVAGMSGTFSEDMKVWSYDKGDLTIRMDTATGPFEETPPEAELVAEEMQACYGGQRLPSPGGGGTSAIEARVAS